MVDSNFNFTHWLKRYSQKTPFLEVPKNHVFLSTFGIHPLHFTKQVFTGAREQQHLKSFSRFSISLLWAEISSKIEGPKIAFPKIAFSYFGDNLAALPLKQKSCMYQMCSSARSTTWASSLPLKCSAHQNISPSMVPKHPENTDFITSLVWHFFKTPHTSKNTPPQETLAI